MLKTTSIPSLFLLSLLLVFACRDEFVEGNQQESQSALFTMLNPEQTQVDFVNQLTEGPNTNILMYEYFYNGGGVATGDLNGDGLTDIYFSSNMDENRLYLNQGDMKFRDITAAARVGGRPGPWKTGITMADVNGDGRLDLYVCYSGMMPDEKRANQLFINEGNDENGIPQFAEKAMEYGLASMAYSNQIYFFDYDRDGDLDALLLNHNPKAMPVLNEVSTAEILKKDDELRGVRLFRNNKGYFEDATPSSGISSSALTYGLGIGIADLNNDGWPDFYISNDYAVPDYLYINKGDGTFTDQLKQSVGHNSHFSMGNDIADFNNDGLPDIVTLDMLPEDNYRQKLLLAPDNYSKFDLNIRSGFHYQYMRNMLQLHAGNSRPGVPAFSEVGQLAGISNTDWSWAALAADFDNNGWKDLYVTNGYLKDFTNLDFIKYMDDFIEKKGRVMREDVLEIIKQMPSSNVVNYMYANGNGLHFSNATKSWGLDYASNSNGAAYADLDNDGDLDLVVNNINQPAFIFENESERRSSRHYLQVNLQGSGLNTQGLGARVTISLNGRKQYLEQMNTRGYLSSVSPVLHFGLGKETKVDTLRVEWLSGKQQLLMDVEADQVIVLAESEAWEQPDEDDPPATEPVFAAVSSPIKHQEPALGVNDFKRQTLLINQLSFSGPCMAKGDVDGDGLEDVFVGGGAGQPGSMFVQQKNGEFVRRPMAAFELDSLSADADAAFFDANGDGHTDLYVASGGYHHFAAADALLQDRLYLNDGRGNFSRSQEALPEMRVSKGCVAVGDVNSDGHPDVFVGGRVVPGRYPEIPQSFLLINDGKGNFSNETASIADELREIGMVTDAVWVDMNNDAAMDLVVVGEWMPVSVFVNSGGKLTNESDSFFDQEYNGWWNTVVAEDLNKDGQPDLLLGNWGLNSQIRVSGAEPAELFYADFDQNGSVDPIFCTYVQGKSFPHGTRDELLDQLSFLRRRFNNYKSYAGASLNDILGEEAVKSAAHLQATHLETTFFYSKANGRYEPIQLPAEAQYSPVHTVTVLDYDSDGQQDVLLCGNNSHSKLRLGKFDANYGALLKGQGNGEFSYISQSRSGLQLKGDVRSVVEIEGTFLFGIGEQELKAYRLQEKILQ